MRNDDTEAAHANPHCTLTRREVAERLGVSTSSVRRLEFAELFPVQDAQGTWQFNEAEVMTLAAKRGRPERRTPVRATSSNPEGRLAARVFKMFARGMNLAQIVVATRQPPHAIRALYSEWCTTLEAAEWGRRDKT